MIITMKKGAPQAEVDSIIEGLEAKGLSVTTILGANYNVFGEMCIRDSSYTGEVGEVLDMLWK